MTASRTAWIVPLAMLAIASAGFAAAAQPSLMSIEPWLRTSVFYDSLRGFNPDTLGLTAGAEAPPVPDLTYPGALVVVAVTQSPDPLNLTILRLVSEIDGLRVGALFPGATSLELAEYAETLGNLVQVIPGSAQWLDDFRIGVAPQGPYTVMFLIDATGTVIHRRLGGLLWLIENADRIPRHLAIYGTLPLEAARSQVLWFGETAPSPCIPGR